MRMELGLSHRQELRMKLAPQIIQSIEILQLPMLDLQELIKQELEENPTLELAEEVDPKLEAKDGEKTDKEKEEAGEPSTDADDHTERGERLEANTTTSSESEYDRGLDENLNMLEALEREWKEFTPTRAGGADSAQDKKLEAMQNTPARSESLQEHLFQQFNLIARTERVRRIGQHLIYNINSSGYLRIPVEEITTSYNASVDDQVKFLLEAVARVGAETEEGKTPKQMAHAILVEDDDKDEELKVHLFERLGADGKPVMPFDEIVAPLHVTLEEVGEVLSAIQHLDPAGVGARDVKECLLLQLDPNDADHEVLSRLIRTSLDDIGTNKLPKVAKDHGLEMADLKEILERLAQMNPRPGRDFAADSIPYILPDIQVDLIDGEYMVRTKETYLPRLCISPYCHRMLQDRGADPKVKEFVRRKIEAAKRLIGSIEQRQHTLWRIADRIVQIQKGFFDQGVTHLKPLRMQEVADQLSIHVSTVSRAISEKYMQTPRGIYALKYFFSGATECAEGEDKSRISVVSRIRDLIESEDGQNPLGDSQIVEILRKEGLDIARRTVTKYRKVLGLSSSRQRKKY
ncbi:MAG: RNA polymerase factor sigma-54 [Planctomycetes bacterium]|nr:RNA polymerase factor sigma-54 [Planctomycetota bacterium]